MNSSLSRWLVERMLPSTIRLTVCRPSPTTVSFTASNAPTRRTVVARLSSYIGTVLRGIISCVIILAFTTKLQCSNPLACTNWVLAIPPLLASIVVTISWEMLLPGGLALLFLCFRRFHKEESLLVLRTLGIQTSTSSSTYLSTSTTRFIPTSQIQDIFIHEAFRGFEVRYYLAIVVKDEKEVTVVFPTLLPSLDIVEQVWRGARQCLFEYSTNP